MINATDVERTKLSANAIDRASTACLAVGIFAPRSGFSQGQSHTSLPALAAITGWFAAAVVLHYAARHVLGGLSR